jgi:hypothetical protein
LVDISQLVNTSKVHNIRSDLFEGKIVANIKGFTGEDGVERSSGYFDREDKSGITWSIQVQGRFLKQYSADDILFGNTFDRPLKLPWGSSAVFKFMNFIDPTLHHDLGSSTKPYALSPLIATMPHFAHRRTELCGPPPPLQTSESVTEHTYHPPNFLLGDFPPSHSIGDYTSELPYALVLTGSPTGSDHLQLTLPSSRPSSRSSNRSDKSTSSSSSKKSKKSNSSGLMQFSGSSQRRSYFGHAKNRKALSFGPQDIITTDFCYGFLEFSPALALRLPGGLSFDLAKYWDGQPVRFICCERGPGEGGAPWGRSFWCITIELAED